MRTPAEKLAWEQQAYGCSEADLLESVQEGTFFGDYGMTAMSLLSNAQEQIEHGSKEGARQTINQAKLVIRKFWIEPMRADPADIEFIDDFGRQRKLTWVKGDESVNIPTGYVLVDLDAKL